MSSSVDIGGTKDCGVPTQPKFRTRLCALHPAHTRVIFSELVHNIDVYGDPLGHELGAAMCFDVAVSGTLCSEYFAWAFFTSGTPLDCFGLTE